MQLAVGQIERLLFGELAQGLRFMHGLAAEVGAQRALDCLVVRGVGLMALRV